MNKKKLTKEQIKAILDEEERNRCEYGTYCDGDDKIFYRKEKTKMNVKSINKKKLEELLDKVPDIGTPEETCISYWQKVGDKMLYVEGWADACLAGTGFPLMEEGETARKIAYIEDLTPEILKRKAKERGLKFLEGGFHETPDAVNLYGVTWGIYEKQESKPK